MAQPLRCEGAERRGGRGALLARARGRGGHRLLHPRARAAGHAAALLLALVGGCLVARALARRVRRLERAAEQVARGQLHRPAAGGLHDELGQLTRTFNEMQRQLRQVDVARKEFIATASHELRTPIFSLGGFVELLQDEELDEETRREFLETMREQVERLQKLAVDLLDLSRLDAGAIGARARAGGPLRAGAQRGREFTPALAEHDTELELALPADGPEANCDRERVAQIMRILLDNALRHTPEGTPVTVSARAAQNGAAGFTVTDSGPGLPEGSDGRCSSASTPATPRAAPGSGWPSPASWPSAWTGACALSSAGAHGVHARAAGRRDGA